MISFYLETFAIVQCCHPISPKVKVRRAGSKQPLLTAQQVSPSVSTPRVTHPAPGVALLLLNSLREEGLDYRKNGFAVCELERLVNNDCIVDFQTVLKYVNEMA